MQEKADDQGPGDPVTSKELKENEENREAGTLSPEMRALQESKGEDVLMRSEKLRCQEDQLI